MSNYFFPYLWLQKDIQQVEDDQIHKHYEEEFFDIELLLQYKISFQWNIQQLKDDLLNVHNGLEFDDKEILFL